MNENEYSDIRTKLYNKLHYEDIISTTEEYTNLNELIEVLNDISKYNNYLIKRSKKTIDKLNRRMLFNSKKYGDVTINNIIFGIEDDIVYYKIYLYLDNNYYVIKKDCSSNKFILLNKYSDILNEEELNVKNKIDAIKKLSDPIMDNYIKIINNFKDTYKNVDFTWNEKYPQHIYYVGDDLINLKIDLHSASNNNADINIINKDYYSEKLSYYIDYFNEELTERTKVYFNDLDSTTKKILLNYLVKKEKEKELCKIKK